MNRLLLIDTFNYIHRAYFALPRTFRDKNGEPVNAVYGMTSMLINTLDILKPTHVIAAYDVIDDKDVFRSADFKDYKANRKEMEPDLKSQLPKIEEIIDAFGIKRVLIPGYEADDVIGTMACIAEKNEFDVVIVSNDKDILQLLSSKVRVFIPENTKEGGKFFGVEEFRAKYGFEPKQMIDFKALRGDASDNIPGVPGIGDKTATTLILKYSEFENIYDHIKDVSPESVKNKLINGKESGVMSKKIATIVCDLSIDTKLDDCRIKAVDRLRVVEILKKYNFKSLIRRLGFEVEGEKVKEVVVDKDQLSLF